MLTKNDPGSTRILLYLFTYSVSAEGWEKDQDTDVPQMYDYQKPRKILCSFSTIITVNILQMTVAPKQQKRGDQFIIQAVNESLLSSPFYRNV